MGAYRKKNKLKGEIKMDVIEATRALGMAIQEDERYKAYVKA